MATSFEGGGQKNFDDGSGQPLAHHAFAQAQHVGIVVHAGHAGQKFVDAHSSPDAGHAVGGHGHAKAGAADEDAEGTGRGEHFVANGLGVIRIVHAGGILGAQVRDRVTGCGEKGDKGGLKGDARMVGTDENAAWHGDSGSAEVGRRGGLAQCVIRDVTAPVKACRHPDRPGNGSWPGGGGAVPDRRPDRASAWLAGF